MTIKIYPSALEGEPLETHEVTDPVTILEWLSSNVEGFIDRAGRHPLSVAVSGRIVDQGGWGTTVIDANSQVKIVVEPEGIEIIIAAVIGVIIGVAGYFMMRSAMRNQPSFNRQTGDALGQASLSANSPRFGQPIPEVAGSPIRYPDYLLPPYTRFGYLENGAELELKSTSYLNTLMCVGRGQYDLAPGSVRIGNTPAIEMSDKFAYEFGDSSAISPEFYEWWHTPSEVGFTSFGGAGLELMGSASGEDAGGTIPEWRPITSIEVVPASPKAIYNSFPAPPSQWRPGMTVRITGVWEVQPSPDTPGAIVCPFLDNFPIVPGVTLSIDDSPFNTTGTPGSYVVSDKNPLSGGGFEYILLGSHGVTAPGLVDIGLPGRAYTVDRIEGHSVHLYVEDYPDWTGFPENPGNQINFRVSVISISGNAEDEGWQGWFSAVPRGECADALELDFILPGGWGRYDNEGRLNSLQGGIEIEIRDEIAGGVMRRIFTWSGSTPNQYGFTHRIDLDTPSRFQVRCRATPAPRGSSDYADRIQWSGLKSRIEGYPTDYEGVTLMSASLIVGDSVGSSAENKISVRAARRLPSLENPSVSETTRDIAPFVVHVLESVGYSRDQIDMDRLSDLDDLWRSRGDTFDAVFSEDSTVKTVVNHALAAGFGELTIKEGLISAVADYARSGIPSRVLGPHMMTAPLVEETKAPQPDDIDGVDIEYVDYITGTVEVASFRLPGDQGTRVRKEIRLGVTEHCKAMEHAERMRREASYRTTVFSGQTEMQALNLQYMDYIGLQDGTPELGQSAYVVSVSGNTVTLSEEIQTGNTIISFVRRDGTATDPVTFTKTGPRTITLSSSPPTPLFTPSSGDEPTVVFLGTTNKWMVEALITDITPSENGMVSFKAVKYDPRIYTVGPCTPVSYDCGPVFGERVLLRFGPGLARIAPKEVVFSDVTGTIAWGDGSFSAIQAGSPYFLDHVYGSESPSYIAEIILTAPTTQRLGYGGNILGIVDWSDMYGGYGAEGTVPNLTEVPNFLPSGVTSLRNLLYGAANFNSPAVSDWDVSGVWDFRSVFAGASSFNQPLNWNTSSGTRFANMFSGASSFNQPVGFDTSNAIDVSGMFSATRDFNQPLNLDLSKAVDVSSFLNSAIGFDRDVSFDLPKAERLQNMLAYNPSFNRKVTLTRIGYERDGLNPLVVMDGFLRNSSSFNNELNLDTSEVQSTNYFFAGATSFNQPIDWDCSRLLQANNMFDGATAMNSPITMSSPLLEQASRFLYQASAFNSTVDIDTSSVQNMSGFFEEATSFNQPVSFDTSSVTHFQMMFLFATSFNQPLDFDTSSAVDMQLMFYSAFSFNQDLSDWCVPLIPVKPSNFDTGTPDWDKEGRQPIWGTCP